VSAGSQWPIRLEPVWTGFSHRLRARVHGWSRTGKAVQTAGVGTRARSESDKDWPLGPAGKPPEGGW